MDEDVIGHHVYFHPANPHWPGAPNLRKKERRIAMRALCAFLAIITTASVASATHAFGIFLFLSFIGALEILGDLRGRANRRKIQRELEEMRRTYPTMDTRPLATALANAELKTLTRGQVFASGAMYFALGSVLWFLMSSVNHLPVTKAAMDALTK